MRVLRSLRLRGSPRLDCAPLRIFRVLLLLILTPVLFV
jgi:hypothetical protein